MIKYPTVRQLRYFIALCEEQHFGNAAAKSFVSQSAFSTSIQELESTLGTQLVDPGRAAPAGRHPDDRTIPLAIVVTETAQGLSAAEALPDRRADGTHT